MKECRYCGKEFTRHAAEHPLNFEKRRYCSKSCASRDREVSKKYGHPPVANARKMTGHKIQERKYA